MTVGNSGSVGRGKEDTRDQEAMTVSPEMLLNQLVAYVGEEFVVIPADGWMTIVNALQDIDKSVDKPDSILSIMEGLKVPVVPVSLVGKREESNIIMPGDAPDGESRIIMP